LVQKLISSLDAHLVQVLVYIIKDDLYLPNTDRLSAAADILPSLSNLSMYDIIDISHIKHDGAIATSWKQKRKKKKKEEPRK
jgi:hypothetical protein